MNPSTPNTSSPGATAGPPWWRVKWMWLVVGIPATTVVAALITIGLAVITYDPPVRGLNDAPPVHIRQAND